MSGTHVRLWGAAAALLVGMTCFGSAAMAQSTTRGRTIDAPARVDSQRTNAIRAPSSLRQDRIIPVAPAGNTSDYNSPLYCPT